MKKRVDLVPTKKTKQKVEKKIAIKSYIVCDIKTFKKNKKS
jgi:hypothetical protein